MPLWSKVRLTLYSNNNFFFVEVIPDALKTECSKCSETQKNGIKQMVHHLIENKHDWYKELEAIYDPDGTYKKRYEDLAKKEGLDI